MDLTNTHRHLVQLFLTNGIVSVKDALCFCEQINPDITSLTQFKTLISEINREISNQYFKIVFTTCEVTAKEALVWINTKNDELSRLQVTFLPIELEYFHVIMREIIDSDDYRLPYPRCINIATTLTAPLSITNGEKVMTKWINGGYFVKDGSSVYLGPRSILEFTTYLRTNTENNLCALCRELVFVGKTCVDCSKKYHTFCIDKYLSSHNACPSCKSTWTQNYVSQNGIDSMDTDDDEARPSRR